MSDFPDWSGSGGGGGYASLTGPGQTTDPGQLNQDGGFVINSNAEPVVIASDASAGHSLTLQQFNAGHLTLQSSDNSSINLQTDTGLIDINAVNGDIQIQSENTSGFIDIFMGPPAGGTTASIQLQPDRVSLYGDSQVNLQYGKTGITRGTAAISIEDAQDGTHACWLYTCFGTPNGVITPIGKGAVCFDTSTPGIWLATSTTAPYWTMITVP